MTRALYKVAGTLAAAAICAVTSAGIAYATTKEEAFATCTEKFKKEFGEAEFSFNKFRRNDGKQLVMGELTLENGEKQTVRCDVRKGRVRDVRYRTGVESSQDGELWTNERPEGAVFVEPKTEEGGTDAEGKTVTKTDGADEGTETAAKPTENGDTAAAKPADGEAPKADGTEPAKADDTAKKDGDTKKADGDKTEDAETAENSEAEPEEPSGPRFIKVPGS